MPPRKFRFDAAHPQAEPGASRSQLKRESNALQAVGEELVQLSAARLAKLPLPPDLAPALLAYPGLKTHEARRRQLQLIGRLMREADEADQLQPLLEAHAALKNASGQANQAHQAAEALRDQLVAANPQERAALLASLPPAMVPQLRHLAESAAANKRAFRELFRLLKDINSEQPLNEV